MKDRDKANSNFNSSLNCSPQEGQNLQDVIQTGESIRSCNSNSINDRGAEVEERDTTMDPPIHQIMFLFVSKRNKY